MDRDKFEAIVLRSLDNLPQEFKERLENVDVVVEDLPATALLKKMRLRNPLQLLGLYQGVPQTRRGSGYTLVLPDKITLFQKSIEARCRNSEKEIEREIEAVVKHEVAHHFGIGDARLLHIEAEKRRRRRSD